MPDTRDRLRPRSRKSPPASVGTPGDRANDVAPNMPVPPQKERRRRNPTLRRLVDDLLNHVRDLSGEVEALSAEELADAQQRFNWIAELTWAAITDEKSRPDADSEQR